MLIRKEFICSKCKNTFIGTLQYDEYNCFHCGKKIALCPECAKKMRIVSCPACGREMKNRFIPGLLY